jgi:multiple antibiotic resistance protein
VNPAFVATAFATAFTIIDPIGMIPLTVSVTGDATPAYRAKIVNQAALVAAAVLLVMGVVGKKILDSLGSRCRPSRSPAACCCS